MAVQVSMKPGPNRSCDYAQQNYAGGEQDEGYGHDSGTFMRLVAGGLIPPALFSSGGEGEGCATPIIAKKDVPDLPRHVERGQKGSGDGEVKWPARGLPVQ